MAKREIPDGLRDLAPSDGALDFGFLLALGFWHWQFQISSFIG